MAAGLRDELARSAMLRSAGACPPPLPRAGRRRDDLAGCLLFLRVPRRTILTAPASFPAAPAAPVAASSATDAWIFPRAGTLLPANRGWALHWNGTRWHKLALPDNRRLPGTARKVWPLPCRPLACRGHAPAGQQRASQALYAMVA